MTPEKQKEIASKGGRRSHALGVGHEWTKEEAREAGRRGGLASRGGRGKAVTGTFSSGQPSMDTLPKQEENYDALKRLNIPPTTPQD